MSNSFPTNKRVSFDLVRVADALAYAVGDEMGSTVVAGTMLVPTWVAASRKGQGAFLSGAQIQKSTETVPVTGYRLYLFRAPITHFGDNVAFAPSDADMLNLIGHINFGVGTMLATNGYIRGTFDANAGVGYSISDLADGETLHGALVSLGVQTGGSGETYRITLDFQQD